MNEEKINEIKDALRYIVDLISKRNKPMPEDLKILLAQVMEHAAQRIQQLRQSETIPSPTPDLPEAPFPSSNIRAFKYDPKTQRLFVKFQDKYPSTNGPVYSYDGVPPFIIDVFSRGAVAPKTSGGNRWHKWKKGITPSLGASMYSLIKNGGYAYARIS